MTKTDLVTWVVLAAIHLSVAGHIAAAEPPSGPDPAEPPVSLTDYYQAELANPRVDFIAGTWTFQTYGSAAFGDENGEIYAGHIGAGYHPWDNVSINLEAFGGHIDFEDGSHGEAAVGGLDLLVRVHIHKGDGWTLFVDVGAGLQQSTRPLPYNGTHFNFRPQGGLGVTVRVRDNAMLIAGARWLHISNANKDGQDVNPGYDSAFLYTGLMIPF